MSEKLHIIDALGPFFVNKPKTETINWSKVLFSDIETNGRLRETTRKKIIRNFEIYLEKVSSLGYDAISIDDIAHMTNFDFYSEDTRALLGDYSELYSQIIHAATAKNMRVYVNTDYLFSNNDIESYLDHTGATHADFFVEILEKAFIENPTISGIVLRMGEKDGNDVKGTFLSKLLLRKPAEANQLLERILPIFEKHGKQLLFRTWTVGAYAIGDLIWNEKTYDTVFGSIDSDALIVSMKFGDTDFMRYLSLNPLLSRGKHKKILELQTRREWEGMGMMPSFVGWDYQAYLQDLRNNETFVGIHVWCQTGGWAKREWTNLTYLEGSSIWNELNTEITIDIARSGKSVESAVEVFCQKRNINDSDSFIELLRLSDIAIKKGLYISDLAKQTLYFRRTRIPPLLWLTWDRIYLPQAVIYLHRMLLPTTTILVEEGNDARDAAAKMLAIAINLKLDSRALHSLRFEQATLEILAQLRRFIAGELTTRDINNLNRQIDTYERSFEEHYSIQHLKPVKSKRLPRPLLTPFVRKSVRYRKRDRLFIKTSSLQARLLRLYLKRSRSHLANQSMGLETLLK